MQQGSAAFPHPPGRPGQQTVAKACESCPPTPRSAAQWGSLLCVAMSPRPQPSQRGEKKGCALALSPADTQPGRIDHFCHMSVVMGVGCQIFILTYRARLVQLQHVLERFQKSPRQWLRFGFRLRSPDYAFGVTCALVIGPASRPINSPPPIGRCFHHGTHMLSRHSPPWLYCPRHSPSSSSHPPIAITPVHNLTSPMMPILHSFRPMSAHGHDICRTFTPSSECVHTIALLVETRAFSTEMDASQCSRC